MTREKAISVLVAHAKGIVSHNYTGDCPDTVEGPDSRDPHCPVCDAIDALKEGEMSEKHTPKPWTRGEGAWSSHVIAPSKFETHPLAVFSGRGRDEDDANAQLTAAAPDLLEALEDLLAQVGRSDAIDTDKAREAVRKARGEA